MKALHVEDKGVSIVLLKRGLYLIDGEYVKVDGYQGTEVQVISTEICPVSVTSIITHYENQDEVLSIEEFEKIKKELESKSNYYDNEDRRFSFEDLDDEYNYRKFMKYHKAIMRSATTIGDPLPVESEIVFSETGNEFIRPIFNVADLKHLYSYSRAAATMGLTKKCFASIGFTYALDDKFVSPPSKKGQWTNSTHSHLKYAKAFGTYLWSGSSPKTGVIKGTLEECVKVYDADKKFIENTILSKYAEHYKQTSIASPKLRQDLDKALRLSGKVRSKVVSKNEHKRLHALLGEILQYVTAALVDEATK